MRKLITAILFAALCSTAFAQDSNDGTLKYYRSDWPRQSWPSFLRR